MTLKILDIDGEKVRTIDLVLIFQDIYFSKPFVIKDIIKKKEKVPEIKVSEDLNVLNEIDYVLYGREIEEEERWAKRQRFAMHLRPIEAPIEKHWKKMKRLPAKHYLELDINNFKIRIVGPFVDLKEQGRWQEY